ncbi:MAG: hypothetical protein DMF78_00835 [Acidobacteria bacterium]|nr:MAG: hypothetical protein DMF78_00835 [Acidobacteriota bacterium]
MDDHAPARYLVSRLLRQEGFLVREAETGTEALRLATVDGYALLGFQAHVAKPVSLPALTALVGALARRKGA